MERRSRNMLSIIIIIIIIVTGGCPVVSIEGWSMLVIVHVEP